MRHYKTLLIPAFLLLGLLPFQNCGGFQSAGGGLNLSSSSVTENGGIGDGGTGDGTVVPVPTTPALPDPIKNLDYVMTFEDDFRSLDTISLGPTGAGVKWWNGTKQCCMDDSFDGNNLPTVMFPTAYNGQRVNPYSLIPGGGLAITVSKQNGFWSSGILSSVDGQDQGFKQKYGYFEIRCKQPKGLGVWPAFWLVNNDPVLPGEIDIFEYYGVSAGLSFAITLHDWRNGGDNKNIPDPIAFPKTVDQTEGFHTYGMLWTEAKMKFYFDGAQTWEVATPEVMKTPYFMYVNNGLGGRWPTKTTPERYDFLVDYVRVYQAR